MSNTKLDLLTAFGAESQANRKYLSRSEKAGKEGHRQIAKLYRGAADAETAHATNHLKVMQGTESRGENLLAAKDGAIDEKAIYVCQVCGYRVEGEATERCPICRAPRRMFELTE